MKSQADLIKLTLRMPPELIERIETAAKNSYCSRSDFIRNAIVLHLNNQKIVSREVKEVLTEDEFLEELTKRYS